MLEKYEHKFLESVIHELKEWRQWKFNTDRILFENEIWKGNIMKTLKDLQDQLTALKQAVADQGSIPAAHDFTPEVSTVSDAVAAINATTVAQGGALTQSTAVAQ